MSAALKDALGEDARPLHVASSRLLNKRKRLQALIHGTALTSIAYWLTVPEKWTQHCYFVLRG